MQLSEGSVPIKLIAGSSSKRYTGPDRRSILQESTEAYGILVSSE